MLFTNPRVLPALLLCVGFSLAGYRWFELKNSPPPDADQIALAVELNYALDLARQEKAGETLPGTQERIDQKSALRQEIVAHIEGERQILKNQVFQGLVAGFLGLALYLAIVTLQARKVLK